MRLVREQFCFLAWGTSVVSLLLRLQQYLGYSCSLAGTQVPSIYLVYQQCLARTYATATLGVLTFPRSPSFCSNAKNNRFYFTCKLYTENFVFEELPNNLKNEDIRKFDRFQSSKLCVRSSTSTLLVLYIFQKNNFSQTIVFDFFSNIWLFLVITEEFEKCGYAKI